jgi:hypothetical protein
MRTRSQGPLLRWHYPASTLLRPCPTPAMAVACRDVEAATLARDGSPPITRTTFPTCRAHYPGGSSGCACRLLPRSCCLPQMAGGSASALSLSRPAQASLTLRPIGSLSRLKRPLSRGSSPASYPTKPLVSFQINRQLSGWILPPLMIHAFGAHGQQETLAQDGHVLGHRLDNLDESTPYRWQVGSSSEDDPDWAKPRQFTNGQRYHSGSRCGLLDAVS